MIDSCHARDKEENRKMFISILRTTLFLARQGLPMEMNRIPTSTSFYFFNPKKILKLVIG